MNQTASQNNGSLKTILSGIAVFVILIMLFFSIYVIGEHEVGIKIDQGEIVGKMTTGPNMEMPFFTSVVTVPTTTLSRQIEGVSSASTDNYTVGNSRVEYMYRIPETKAIELYKKYPNYEELIRSEVENATKDVLGQYKLIDIPNKREQIGNDIVAMVQKRLTNDMGVKFKNAALTYYEWGDQGKSAIRRIQNAQSKKVTEQEKLEAQKIKNERKDADLEARLAREEKEQDSDSEREIQRANSKAEASIIEAKAEAKSLKKIAKVLENNPALLRRQAIQEWDGKMPIIGSGNVTPEFKLDLNGTQTQQ